jgi:hypothetical protein
VLADPLKYHYAFFWDEADSFIGYYKTNKGIATNGAYLGQVNTQSIPLPLNAYSFALVRYDNDYVLVNGFTIEELFIDNNLAGVDPDDFNDIPIAELNGLTLNDVFQPNEYDNTNDFTNIGTATMVGSEIRVNTLNPIGLSDNITIPNNNLIYWYANFRNDNVANIGLRFRNTGTVLHSLNLNISSLNGRLQSVILTTSNTIDQFEIVRNTSTDNNLFFTSLGYVNLTALGITSLTQTQLDTYNSIYLNGVNATYYATNGNVSSVDGYYYAAGKNLFDGFIELGTIAGATGAKVSHPTFTRSENYTTIKQNTQYTISSVDSSINNFLTQIYVFDINFVYIREITATATTGGKIFNTGSNAEYILFLNRTTSFSDIRLYQLEQGTVATAYEGYAAPTTTLNLTFLFGVGNEPNKATMDGYYQDYEDWQDYSFILPLAFNTQTLSFETIYFDDGVSTEIEAIGSILIFTIIGFTLMIFGFTSRRRLFNLLSIGAFVVLGFLLIEFVGFIVILFGLIFINVYYTFFGEL